MTYNRILTIGETMGLATNLETGPLFASRNHMTSFGGAESNVAIALVRLGAAATWVSRLGEDPFGELIARELRAEGVDVVASIDHDRPTGFMHKLRRTRDNTVVTFWRGGSAASGLSERDVTPSLFDNVDVLHLTGILPGLSDNSHRAARKAAQLAKELGVLLSFDVNHRAKVWQGRSPNAVYLDLVEQADICFAGADEAEMIVGSAPPEELAIRLASRGPSQVIIKMGAAGAVAFLHGEHLVVPAVQVHVIDTVGAGDAFVAGYLSALLSDAAPRRRLEIAAAAGAFACTSVGDWEGAPTWSDLASLERVEGVQR